MKTTAITLIALSLTAGAASAADRLTDVDYLKAARCKGIAEGMGNVDTASLNTLLKKEGATRLAYIQQKGESETARGRRDAKREIMKPQLAAELSGPCVAYLGGGATVAASKADSPI